jgi:Sulfotransferase domain
VTTANEENDGLPNLLVVGVPKAGTGSLFAYLSQHPDICPGDEKEIGYFNHFNPLRHRGPVPPLETYRRHFVGWRDERYAFEATPTYSYGGRPVIEAIRDTLLRPRVVLILRNPVDRLWSAYTFQRELGNASGFASFEDYLAACRRRRRDGTDLVPGDHLHGLYIGYYADYVPLWLQAFGDDMRVIFTEHLVGDPVRVVGGLFEWLGIDAGVATTMDLAARNRTNHPRSVLAARLAYSVKRSTERRGRIPARVREPVRRLYQRANSGKPPEGMTPGLRREIDELYAESNQQTAAALRAHGYEELPAWLRERAPAD